MKKVIARLSAPVLALATLTGVVTAAPAQAHAILCTVTPETPRALYPYYNTIKGTASVACPYYWRDHVEFLTFKVVVQYKQWVFWPTIPPESRVLQSSNPYAVNGTIVGCPKGTNHTYRTVATLTLYGDQGAVTTTHRSAERVITC